MQQKLMNYLSVDTHCKTPRNRQLQRKPVNTVPWEILKCQICKSQPSIWLEL